MLLFPLKNALRYSEPPSAIIAAVATATRQKQAAEMPRKAEFRYHLLLCCVSSSASEIYFSFMSLNAVKRGKALCSFIIFSFLNVYIFIRKIFSEFGSCAV